MILDAQSDDDLAAIARAALELPDCIPAGSAGLAGQYSRCLYDPVKNAGKDKDREGLPLIIVGTRNPVTVEQVQHLKKLNLETHLLNTDEYGIHVESRELISVRQPEGFLLTTNLIYHNAPNREQVMQNCYNSEVLEEIAAQAEKICHSQVISAIIASGGDVCSAVLEALKLNSIDLCEEVLPGVASGTACSEDGRKMMIITKSGGFGNEEALVKLYEYVR